MSTQLSNHSTNSPKVSIIMNCLNCEKYLREAIDSVYAQTYKDWEIIFWDNASTDKSVKIAKSYNGLRYFISNETVPLGKARNIAIEQASGEYIAFLDCDDLWLPIKLEKQVELLDSNKKLGLVYSDSYIIDEKVNLIKKTFFEFVRPYRGDVFNELFLNNFIPLLTAIIRKDVLNKVGLFNSKYTIAEEYDLWLRIAEYYPIDFIEKPMAKYRIHRGNISRNTKLSIFEDLQIIEYWLNTKKDLRKELGREIKQKKANLYRGLTIYYCRNHESKKAMREFINWIKMFPYNLTLWGLIGYKGLFF